MISRKHVYSLTNRALSVGVWEILILTDLSLKTRGRKGLLFKSLWKQTGVLDRISEQSCVLNESPLTVVLGGHESRLPEWLVNPLAPGSAKPKMDKFSKLTNWVKLKKYHIKLPFNSFLMKGHTWGLCP